MGAAESAGDGLGCPGLQPPSRRSTCVPASRPVIVRGTNDKPVASEALASLVESISDPGAQLFIGYPIIGAADGAHPIDALYFSPRVGLVIFDLVEGADLGEYDARQDDAANKLQSKLLTFRSLVRRRHLLIAIHTVTFAPAARVVPDEEYPVTNAENFVDILEGLSWADASNDVFKAAVSALENISALRRNRQDRIIEHPDSRGARLLTLEKSIATLDALQSKAVIETVNDVQRIRGLAGSGKTIVLALKAAYLHAQHPSWEIAVTFNSRALKAHFERLITAFAIEQTGDEPNWSKVRIVNSWGAAGGQRREGIYHQFCVANGIEYLNYNEARDIWGSQGSFAGVCSRALSAVEEVRPLYDAILVDEAQDLPIEFLRICYLSLRAPKRLVYAYDELQNLSGGAGLPSATEIFGLGDDGAPIVSFESSSSTEARRDIILEKCYRNSRPVLVTAHAMGFGTYRTPQGKEKVGLVQMFDQPDLWTDVGYQIKSGKLADGKNVVLARNSETSPLFLESHSPLDDLIQFKTFDSTAEQSEWVAEAVRSNLEDDELRFDDIILINTDPLAARRNFGPVRKALLDRKILSHIAGVDTDAETFFQPGVDSVTCTGIYRAKGNEAAMVYIINAQECFASGASLARVRNRLFTAITRSKAWVRVLGVGPEMTALAAEFERVVHANYELRFRYPNKKELAEIQIVHRDMTEEESSKVRKRRENVDDIVSALRNGSLFLEDLDDETVAALKLLLQDNE